MGAAFAIWGHAQAAEMEEERQQYPTVPPNPCKQTKECRKWGWKQSDKIMRGWCLPSDWRLPKGWICTDGICDENATIRCTCCVFVSVPIYLAYPAILPR